MNKLTTYIHLYNLLSKPLSVKFEIVKSVEL